MSELSLFWRSVSLWFWLLMRLAVMAAILFGSLLLTRTIFDPGNCFRNDGQSVELPHFGYILIHAPILLAFWLTAHSIFRTTNRKTALQHLEVESAPALPTVLIVAVLLGASAVTVFGSVEYRLAAVGWVTAIFTAPVLWWVLFEPGVFHAFAKADEQAREAERQRRRNSPPDYELRMRITRRDYETKIRDINRMPVDEDERLYLQELADSEYRDRVRRIIAGNNALGSGGQLAPIESLLQNNEDDQ